MRKNEDYAIFIEEPEAHLHPKWQRFFMEIISSKFPAHQFFITTHSSVIINHKSSNLYTVRQTESKDKSIVEFIKEKNNSILNELGYKASDLLNSNFIIWVEGISDKIYLKKFIHTFDNNLEEGIDYTIMMYGGCSQLKHIILKGESDLKVSIENLNSSYAFCIDSDNSVGTGFNLSKEKQEFKTACDNADKLCWISEVREIENFIPLNIWKNASLEYVKSIDNYKYEVLSTHDVDLKISGSFSSEFSDRMKTFVKINSKGTRVNINDKIKMANTVVKLFPKNTLDLKINPQLFENIEKLVIEIKKANN